MGPCALSYYSHLTLLHAFQPMAAQLSKKAALPLAEILATTSCHSSNTGPWCRQDVWTPYRHHCLNWIAEIYSSIATELRSAEVKHNCSDHPSTSILIIWASRPIKYKHTILQVYGFPIINMRRSWNSK